MIADRVPGVSIAVIHNGEIEWAQGFGVVRLGGEPVTAETLFQAGSISKPVSAMAALRLVQPRCPQNLRSTNMPDENSISAPTHRTPGTKAS